MIVRFFFAIGLVALVTSCAIFPDEATPHTQPPSSPTPAHEESLSQGTPLTGTGYLEASPSPRPPEPKTQIYPGSGVFIDRAEAATPLPKKEEEAGDITLNFEAADLREVVKFILGDLLNENYVVDPRVRGQVTLQTSRPLAREALIPTLESVLRMNGMVLLRKDGLYRVLPLEGALQGNVSPRLPSGIEGQAGYEVHIIPLRYIAAQEMQKILEPFLPPGGLVRVDPARNLLLLAGTAQELAHLQETVDIFDVNWLEGMSVGLFKLRNMDVKTVVAEMEAIFKEGSQNPLAGMFRFVPMERLDSVIVITPQAAYLEEARKWLERLDQLGEAEAVRRLYVYPVQNGKAEHLGDLLNQVYQEGPKKDRPAPLREAELAPGLEPAEIRTTEGEAAEAPAPTPAPATTGGGSILGEMEARIIPDLENNSLLILATASEYDNILAALQKLDISPRQVLVEATIAEVTLTGELSYGLQWFFKNNDVLDKQGTGSLDLGINTRLNAVLGSGFTYALSDSAGIVRAVLNTLAQDSKVRILSSPQLLVVDNQTARIRVGDQQPVQTSTTVTEGGVITESIQFKDTGVTLEVTPHVNAGGLVTMEISQELTEVGEIDPATRQRSFLQRAINSSVVVQSGQGIVLGGLISETASSSQSGVPGLYKLPIVGPLFGSTDDRNRRTELIVLITPRVINNSLEAQQVTHELRQRMRAIPPLFGEGLPLSKRPQG